MRIQRTDERDPLDQYFQNLGEHLSCLAGDPEWFERGGDLRKEIDRLSDLFDVLDEKCESPIELMMATELIFLSVGLHRQVLAFGGTCMGIDLRPQEQIGSYRVDFLVELDVEGKSAKLVIECDGHDYHERTKEQAERDKSRDRDLTAQGYAVIRFTGSEIWRGPGACRDEVCKITNQMLARLRGQA